MAIQQKSISCHELLVLPAYNLLRWRSSRKWAHSLQVNEKNTKDVVSTENKKSSLGRISIKGYVQRSQLAILFGWFIRIYMTAN